MFKSGKVKILLTSLLLIFVLGISSCSKKESEFSKIKKEAQKKNQKILLVFTGNKWSQESLDFTNAVLNDKDFNKTIAKNYIVFKIDYENDFEDSVLDKKNINENVLLGQEYSLSQIPQVYLLSPQGYVMTVLDPDDKVNSASSLEEKIFSKAEEITHIEFLLSEINSKEGSEKVYAINSLYEATDANYRLPLRDLITEIPNLDPENTTELLGKYELELAYMEAITAAQNKNLKGISDIFEKVCQEGHLTPSQTQTAYYTEAFVLAGTGSKDYDKLIEILQKAYDADKESENADQILYTLTSFEQLKALDQKSKENSQPVVEGH